MSHFLPVFWKRPYFSKLLEICLTDFEQLQKQIAELTRRIWNIEQRLGITTPSLGLTSRIFPPAESSISSNVQVPSSLRAESRSDMERRIGGKWTLWVGSIAIIFALAFFVAYSWDYFSPEGRLGFGFLFAALFLYIGISTRGRMPSWFSESFIGTGLAILYLTIWTGTVRYHFFSPIFGVLMMAGVCACGVIFSVWYDAVSLIMLSTLGGYMAPVLVEVGGSTLHWFIYLTLLNAGIVGVSLYKHWKLAIWLAFVSTTLLVIIHGAQSYIESERWIYFTFMTLFFLLFFGASSIEKLLFRRVIPAEDQLLLLSNALAYAIGGQSLLRPILGNFPGLFPGALGIFLLFAARMLGTLPVLIKGMILILWGVTEETYKIFEQYKSSLGPNWDRAAAMGVSLVWILFSTLLLIWGVLKQVQPLRVLALILFGITILKVFLFDLSFLTTPYRVASFGALGGALIGISWLYSRYGRKM